MATISGADEPPEGRLSDPSGELLGIPDASFGEEYGAFEEQIFSVSGEHDLLIKARFFAPDNLGRFVNEKLHHIPNIRGTKTIIAFNAFAPRQKVAPEQK